MSRSDVPPSRHRSAFSVFDGRVRANSSRLTWTVRRAPYRVSISDASTAQGPARPSGSSRAGAALTPQFGATVNARGELGRSLEIADGSRLPHRASTETGKGRPAPRYRRGD